MATKKYDIVVYGATGFTGQYTVDEVARVAEEENLSWAVAGRNMAKIQKVLSESSSRTGKNLEETPIIIADSSSLVSLETMAKQARVVLNCVGPYRFYGESVVRACIEQGTHHLDISGEPQFLEKMQLLYNGKAKDKNTFVIGATGFDSVPAESGVMYMEEQFKGGRLTNVENFVKFHRGPKGSAVNTGTFESAVHAIANWNEVKDIRSLLYPESMPRNEYKLPKRVLFYSGHVNKWCVPFVGIDEAIVYRTTRDSLATGRRDKPAQFAAYMCMPNFIAAIGFLTFATIFGILAYFSPTRWLLLKFPNIFTFGTFRKGGPTKEQIDGCSFAMTFVGHGFDSTENVKPGVKPNRCVVAKLTGPEPGYVTTPICMVQCGVVILKEAESMQHKGGVLTAGAAFSGTKLLERLDKHNIKITTISDTIDK
ncbi:saccharopine dehydrogenase oxidoreductase [Plakobranchus ocellatus]|uniref:Saccharopine dehydrogenase oxidoreductase n=1 Tax=Plakobranchus ocellatus TaxID=259542 RepID=A0AAV4CEJ9_9GAST|nr:saccharopine dehydrogenase oxidoreductase [Plakobranchus ocellatus]